MSFQQITLLGNLGQAASTREHNGQTVVNFSLATNYAYTDGTGQRHEVTTWFTCEYWLSKNQTATVASYLTGGKRVLITGMVRPHLYTDKQGQPRAEIRVKVDTLKLADSAPKPDTGQPAPTAGADFRGDTGQPARTSLPLVGAREASDAGELPF